MDGAELRARRLALKLTQLHLGRLLGVPQSTVARWETGALPIRHPRILQFAMESLRDDDQPVAPIDGEDGAAEPSPENV